MTNTQSKKLIIVDVDGVIFKGHFLLYLARYRGVLIYIRTALLCVLFNMNRVPFTVFIRKVYERFNGVTFEVAEKVYKNIPLIRHAKETIHALRRQGYPVILLSSGVPDYLVKALANRLSASNGYGLEIGIKQDTYTGEVAGILSQSDGKIKFVETVLNKHNITWQDTIVLVDDRNNCEMMDKAGINIGVNAHYPVRKRAHYLVDSGDLNEILDILNIADADEFDRLSAGMRKQFSHVWYQEIRRKFIHVFVACVPFFSGFAYHATLLALFSITIVYLISESLRINGFSLPLFGDITRLSIRKKEERFIAFGPVTLVLGACISLIFFPTAIANTAIWIVAFSDTAAMVVGKSIGNHRIPYNINKSIEGSTAALFVGFICASIYLPVFPAFLAAFTSSVIESLPIRALDNLLMPMGAGLILLCF